MDRFSLVFLLPMVFFRSFFLSFFLSGPSSWNGTGWWELIGLIQWERTDGTQHLWLHYANARAVCSRMNENASDLFSFHGRFGNESLDMKIAFYPEKAICTSDRPSIRCVEHAANIGNMQPTGFFSVRSSLDFFAPIHRPFGIFSGHHLISTNTAA